VDLSAGMGGSGAMASQEERPPVQDQPLAKPPPTAAEVSAAKAAKQKRMDSQLDKLDALINQADNAQIAMSEQTQQMRRLAKWSAPFRRSSYQVTIHCIAKPEMKPKQLFSSRNEYMIPTLFTLTLQVIFVAWFWPAFCPLLCLDEHMSFA